jgi:hypothetical protein
MPLTPLEDDERPKTFYLAGMTLRPPHLRSFEPRADPLDYEIVQEQAAALGRLGRGLEAALGALAAYDRAQDEHRDNFAALSSCTRAVRDRLVQDASDALWCFIIQREACGLRDQGLIVREYCVPRDVQNRMGAFSCRSRPSI